MKIWTRMWLLAAIGGAVAGVGCTGTADESSSNGTTSETSTTTSETSTTSSETSSTTTSATVWEGPAECTEGEEAHLISGLVTKDVLRNASQVVLALTTKRVYYLAATEPSLRPDSTPALMWVSKEGGGAHVLGWINAHGTVITTADERLYYPDVSIEYDEYNGGRFFTPELREVTIGGDPPAPIVDPKAPSGFVPVVASNGTHVFWATHGQGVFNVYRLPVQGGPADMESLPDLPTETLHGLEADDGALYFRVNGALYRASTEDATAEKMAITNVRALAFDKDNVYVARSEVCGPPGCEPKAKGIIGYFPKGGDGDLTVLDEDPSRTPMAIAVDDDNVYWIAHRIDGYAKATRVYKMPKAGGDKVQLAEGYGITSIAVDDTCLFWGDRVDGGVWKVHK